MSSREVGSCFMALCIRGCENPRRWGRLGHAKRAIGPFGPCWGHPHAIFPACRRQEGDWVFEVGQATWAEKSLSSLLKSWLDHHIHHYMMPTEDTEGAGSAIRIHKDFWCFHLPPFCLATSHFFADYTVIIQVKSGTHDTHGCSQEPIPTELAQCTRARHHWDF